MFGSLGMILTEKLVFKNSIMLMSPYIHREISSFIVIVLTSNGRLF